MFQAGALGPPARGQPVLALELGPCYNPAQVTKLGAASSKSIAGLRSHRVAQGECESRYSPSE